jgi:hypothetical protein
MNDGRRTTRGARCVAGVMLAAVLVASAGPARADDAWSQAGRNGGVAFDLIVLRPLNALALALGAVFFCASAPFVAWPTDGSWSFPSAGLSTAYDVFIFAPYEYTVLRPLGEF